MSLSCGVSHRQGVPWRALRLSTTVPPGSLGDVVVDTDRFPVAIADREPERERSGSRLRLRAAPTFLALCVVAGAVLRLWGLGAHRLGYDEAFTAMAGRLSLGEMFGFLRLHDSHPPLDYLLHAPLARLGVGEFMFRLPGALCSIGALALFAWWMRRRGVAGVVATALLAVSAFELRHGREARMYADLELIGVAAAVLADSWLRRPRRWHAPAVGALVAWGLLTHVSMFLLAAGLLAIAGLRRDREAWRWRAAIALGGVGWALLWGRSFLVQAGGGHSSWIPRSTVDRVVHTFGALVTDRPELHLLGIVAVVGGAIVVSRRDRVLGRVVVCCAFIPATLVALGGLVAPLLLDRTLTLMAWAGALTIGFLVAELGSRAQVLAIVALLVLGMIMLPATVRAVEGAPMPDAVLRHLEQVAQPGDVVAVRPAGKLSEIEWTLGVRSGKPYRVVSVHGLGASAGIRLAGSATGRTWLLDWERHPLPLAVRRSCAPPLTIRRSRVLCIQ
jgi:hypothetical protein